MFSINICQIPEFFADPRFKTTAIHSKIESYKKSEKLVISKALIVRMSLSRKDFLRK